MREAVLFAFVIGVWRACRSASRLPLRQSSVGVSPSGVEATGWCCSQISGNGASIFDNVRGDEIPVPPPAAECVPISFRYLGKGERLIMADVDPCDVDLCGAIELELQGLAPGDRLRVAGC